MRERHQTKKYVHRLGGTLDACHSVLTEKCNIYKEINVEIIDNSILNNLLKKFGLHIDDLQNINFISEIKYPIESMLNTYNDAQSIISISYNITGWLTERKCYPYTFFKLSLLSCLLYENNFIVSKLLTPAKDQCLTKLIEKLNSKDKYYDAYKFKNGWRL